MSKRPPTGENSKSPSKKHRADTKHGKPPPIFPTYLDAPNLAPKLKLLCQVIATTPASTVEKVLEETGFRVTQEDVEEALKLSYGYPAAAVKFFRWAGYQLKDQHSPYSWNLVVDLLGKNYLYDAMWDAIKSMRKEGLLSLATFASVFSSYVGADRVDEAIMTFEVMDQYGCPRDIVALNSLLSAICRDGKTEKADTFLCVAKGKIRPDSDTYAILLEGWENEGNIASARQTFTQMVVEIGWDPANTPAYDSFLCTLLKGSNGFHEAMKFFSIMRERRCIPGFKFFRVALAECVRRDDACGASLLWEALTARNAYSPDLEMYYLMISLNCNLGDPDIARKFLDDMVYYGTFPDSRCYNALLGAFIKSRKLPEASLIFTEMVKNECVLSQSNCSAGVKIFIDQGDAYTAVKFWKWMLENSVSGLEETGNDLVLGLRDINRLPEAVKHAEHMIDRGIRLHSSTLSKLKQSLHKERKEPIYDELLKKWKLVK